MFVTKRKIKSPRHQFTAAFLECSSGGVPAPPCASPLAVVPQQRCALCWPSAAIRFLPPSFTAPQSRALSLFLLQTSPESSSPMRPSGTPSTLRHTMAAACSANFFDFSLKTKNEFVQLKVVKGILLLNAGSVCACVCTDHSEDLYFWSATVTTDWKARS